MPLTRIIQLRGAASPISWWSTKGLLQWDPLVKEEWATQCVKVLYFQNCPGDSNFICQLLFWIATSPRVSDGISSLPCMLKLVVVGYHVGDSHKISYCLGLDLVTFSMLCIVCFLIHIDIRKLHWRNLLTCLVQVRAENSGFLEIGLCSSTPLCWCHCVPSHDATWYEPTRKKFGCGWTWRIGSHGSEVWERVRSRVTVLSNSLSTKEEALTTLGADEFVISKDEAAMKVNYLQLCLWLQLFDWPCPGQSSCFQVRYLILLPSHTGEE